MDKERSIKDKDMEKIKESFIQERVNKLSTAVYLVSGLIADNEPIKSRLRDMTLMLVSEVGRSHLEAAKKTIPIIVSILQISDRSGTVSSMNVDVLAREFDLLAKDIGELGSLRIDMITAGDSTRSTNRTRKLELVKSLPRIIEDTSLSVVETGSRKDLILSQMEVGKEYSIREILDFISGCSEKTIQRDLVVLVGEGRLEKRGERRWSRYLKVSL